MPGRNFRRHRIINNFKRVKELGEVASYVDAGEIEVVAALKEVPDGVNQFFDSQERKFGCLPWILKLQKGFDLPRDHALGGGGGQNVMHFIKVTLQCNFNEQTNWKAKASGVLTMEKWPEKMKAKATEEERKSEYKEIFSRKFNTSERSFNFLKRFPVPTKRSSLIGHSVVPADSPYLKNGQFRFRLEIIIHNIRKSLFPHYDFAKKTPMSDAIVKIVDPKGNIHRFHVNKEYLSMHSDALQSLFTNTGFVEGASGEAELKFIEHTVFNEFLGVIYPCRQRPHIKYIRGLLEFARMFFIPMVTAICEQRLLVAEESEMAIGERLKLADQYGLFQLKSRVMQQFDPRNMDDKFLEGLSPETLAMLIRKQKNMKEKSAGKEGGATKKSGGGKKDELMDVDQQPAASSSSAAAVVRRAPQPQRSARPGVGAAGGAGGGGAVAAPSSSFLNRPGRGAARRHH